MENAILTLSKIRQNASRVTVENNIETVFSMPAYQYEYAMEIKSLNAGCVELSPRGIFITVKPLASVKIPLGYKTEFKLDAQFQHYNIVGITVDDFEKQGLEISNKLQSNKNGEEIVIELENTSEECIKIIFGKPLVKVNFIQWPVFDVNVK